jgi:uncharacterized protein YbjQ (UPF0145 family)
MTFTSDLSIDEILLIEEVGFEPLQLVLSSSYFHIGWQTASWSTNTELDAVSALMLRARHTAIDRLVHQATVAGADGIVGMRLDIEREGHSAEFTAIGTAVKRRAGDGAAWRDGRGRPFTCDLSGVDFWALVRGGFRPVTLAHGVCVYHVAHRSLSGWLSSMGQNLEMPAFTQGLYEARELAMERMQSEARSAGSAAGIVGVNAREGSHGWDSHVIEFVAVGTGVSPIADPDHEVHGEPGLVLDMQDVPGEGDERQDLDDGE